MTRPPTHLSYRLEPNDLGRCLAAGRRCACRSQCVGWAWSLATLAPIVLALIFGAARFRGARAAFLAIGAGVVILIAIAAIRELIARRRCRTLARDLGLPRDVHLTVTPEGIAQEPDADGIGRSFAWSQVAEVSHRCNLTVVRLRVAGSALLIPDRAFATIADREAFTKKLSEHSKSVAIGLRSAS